MNHLTTAKHALLHALAAAVYIALVATLLSNGGRWFGAAPGLLGTIALLLTFVTSAAVMGIAIFGKPLLWYLNGQKREAISLALYTIAFLALIAIIVFLILALRTPH